MSDKRIFIREVENPCADCENKGCNVCHCGEIWKAAIPRAEAVERMAKAMNKERCRPALRESAYWDFDKKELLREADAALLEAKQ